MQRRNIGIVVMVLALTAFSAAAQAPGGSRTAPAPTIDAATGKVLNEAIELLNKQDFDGAERKLSTLRLDGLSPYERSKVEQIRFNVAYSAGRFPEAREHLAAAVDAGGLNAQEISQVQYQSAQLLMQESHWQEGAAALEKWFATAEKPNAAAYYLLAVAYYQNNDFERALAPAQRAVELGDPPQEAWVGMLVALHLQRKELADAARLLQRLIVLVPGKRTYWMQLSSVYGQMEDYQSAVGILQVAYDAGLLTEDSDIRRLADLLLFNDLPYRGARVLEAAIDAQSVTLDEKLYEKLASCWIAAHEFDRAVAPLQRAAELSSSGEPLVRLGEVDVQREDWAAAEAALGRALTKGGLSDSANAKLLLGITLFNEARLAEARERFLDAAQSPAHEEAARAYVDLIDNQLAQSRL
jgi:tetratricopeptide (TPR) repeat protein